MQRWGNEKGEQERNEWKIRGEKMSDERRRQSEERRREREDGEVKLTNRDEGRTKKKKKNGKGSEFR